MKINTLGISQKGYKEKPTSQDKIIYQPHKDLTIDEFTGYIQSGYCFTHSFSYSNTYGRSFKKIENFKETNYLWFDFDNSDLSLIEVQEKLTYKPNLSYTTLSDGLDGKGYRFRMIYITDFSIINNDDYKYYLNILVNSFYIDLGKDYLKKHIDNNCFNVAQQMFGGSFNSTIITGSTIYNKDVFNHISSNFIDKDFLSLSKCSKNSNSDIIKRERTLKHLKRNTTLLIEMLKAFDIKRFTPTLSNECNAILNTDEVYTDVSEQEVYKINFIYTAEGKIKKVKKGYRNSILFSWGLTIRNINPEITIEELTKNIYWLYINRCEQSSDFNLYKIVEISTSVFNVESYGYNTYSVGKKKYLINPSKKGLNKKEKAKELGKARRKSRDEWILGDYDPSKSIKENAEFLERSESTIRNCLKDNNIKIPKEEKYIKFSKILKENPNLSIRRLMRFTGLSNKTVQKYKKRYLDENISK